MDDAMTPIRSISLPLHGALELLVGVLALVAPFALGFTPAGTVIAVLVAVCMIGLAFDATQPAPHAAAHHALDYGLALGAVLVALPLALAGDAPGALALAALGLIQLGLNATTRYSARAS
jgi:hypothetical protein